MNAGHNESAVLKRLAHALVDGLADDATWEDLAAEVRFQIELEQAVVEAERSFLKGKPVA